MNIEEIIKAVESAECAGKKPMLIGIDGKCASGKSTLASALAEKLSADVIHMDDFFLRPEQRCAERYAEPGGNSDRERLIDEVIRPLISGERFSYRPFDCHRMDFGEPVEVTTSDITIIEGTYSCHPDLWDYYALHIFLSTDYNVQLERIARRSPDKVEEFKNRWIPLEENYFSAFNIRERCELKFDT